MARPDKQRLLVIDPSTENPEDECCAEVLAGWQGEAQVLQPALRPGDGPTPGTGYDCDGVVVLGSRASVHDRDLPWLADLGAWLQPLVTGEIVRPVLGICFGHQLLAHLAGGNVGFLRGDRSKNAGFCHTELAGGRLQPGRRRLQVVISHREVVHTLPPFMRAVGSRPGVPIDAFEHLTLPLFGVQFHPEARGDFCRFRNLDFDAVAKRIRSDGNRILDAFRDLVRTSPEMRS